MRTKRIDEIELYIKEKKSVSLDTLCEQFQVSKNTIRRDIAALEKTGKIKKVYGGVTIADRASSKTLIPFSERHQQFMKEKRAICHLAATHIQDGDTIFIDSGTTCHSIIDFISNKTCTIITNSLQVSLKALPYENLTVISLPGFLKRETLSFVDSEIADYVKSYNIGKAFMSCTGISIQSGLTNASQEEYLVKKAVVENSIHRYILADHSKFGSFSLMTYCPLEDASYILTDQLPEQEFLDFCQNNTIEIETI